MFEAQDKKKCRDELVVTESHQFKLLSTCGDQDTAIAILSDSHQLNVTLNPQSRLAFPKRGFLAYYRGTVLINYIHTNFYLYNAHKLSFNK